MDRGYWIWLGVFAVGGVLGLFLKPRVVGILVGSVLAMCFAVFGLAVATSSETLAFLLGMGLMVVPPLGGILFAGAAVADAALGRRRKRGGSG